ncbi:flavin-containing monooxygenase [Aspergillus candidus]|uniref:Putative flavo protein n=1 Tax=Aspergillus candidus TaxID=41067 RepID=A0A2I2FNI1_ASPCN|nr:putative flavo protein [Aspergillus candidus]PLB42175.1 putative flavo protein [Aspergillus candidus]
MTESYRPGEKPLDVLIIGAGISGINAAYHLRTELPHYHFAILEARDNIGGTWDLFRYPGIRSDSDLYTFGFSWHRWNRSNPIAEGADILEYLDDAATTYRLKDHILFNHRVSSLEWAQNQWTAEVQHAGVDKTIHARFIIFATGYYDYHQPLTTDIPGLDHFEGRVIHPQFWPESLDYTDKRIVVIGSGATAVTLIPKLAERAELVTMLQRSPSYIVAVPNSSQNSWWARLLPKSCVYYIRRIFRLVFGQLFFRFCRAFPGSARAFLDRGARSQLPADVPLNPHFKPRYNPWEQRLCASPDGDFFKALASRKAAIQTDTISTVDTHGIRLSSGTYVPADIIVTATGLRMQICGGIPLTVNGKPLDIPQKFMWNGLMLQDLPNAALSLGYVNASWTLGADACMQLTCRMLKLLEKGGLTAVVPVRDRAQGTDGKPMMSLSSTYLVRAQKDMPRASAARPWVARTDYFSDMFFGRYGDVTAGLEFV